MLITRIVTVYNQWEYLSWVNQDALFDPDTEYIVIDDASPQSLPPTLHAHFQQRRVRYHRLPHNAGRSTARNTGASLANTEFIEFIDGDDRPLPLRFSASWSSHDIIFFPTEAHGPEHTQAHLQIRHPLLGDPLSPTGFRDPRPAATLWRRESFLDLGGFDPRMEPVEDLDLVWRARHRPIGYAFLAKQSYNCHGSFPLKSLAATAGFIKFYLQLPSDVGNRDKLIDTDLRNLWLQSTWFLLPRGNHGFLFRQALYLLVNVATARLRSFFSTSR